MAIKLVLAGIAAATAVVGGVMAARAYKEQGKQAQQVHEFNAELDERNAKVAENEAEQIQRVSDFENEQWQIQANQLADQQLMAFGKLGWQSSGTPALIAADNANDIEQERQIRDYNAAVASDQKIEQGVENRMQAQLNRAYGQQAAYAGRVKAGTSLLGTARTLGSIALSA